jgi:hypothetical protein
MKNAKKNNKFFDTAEALCEEVLTKSLRKVGVIQRSSESVVKNHHSFVRDKPLRHMACARPCKGLKRLFFS